MIENLLSILKESLEKKIVFLTQLQEINEVQGALIEREKPDFEQFDTCVDEKDQIIQELMALDNGFESLYEKIRVELLEHKDSYKTQIKELQQLISIVTEKSVAVQTAEQRNKDKFLMMFGKERRKLNTVKKSTSVAYNYYKTMSKATSEGPTYLDKKK